MSDSIFCLYYICRNYVSPVLFIGGAAGYRPRVQNVYSAKTSESSSLARQVNYNLLEWKLQVFKL